MSAVKYMDIREFREAGYLQEVNRQFLHPLGLALEVRRDTNGTEHLGGVWDYREDPEGIVFEGIGADVGKAATVAAERARHEEARRALLGDPVQTLGSAA